MIGLNDVSESDRQYMTEAVKRMVFHSAGGDAPCDQVLPLDSKPLGGRVEPFVMKSSPPVLSIGRRVMEHGCSF